MRLIITILSLILISAFSFAQNRIETAANILGVTVYTSSAEIKYQKEISILKGQNIIVFSDLTPYIVDNSLNVGFEDKSINIITVTEKINYLKENKNTRIKKLTDSIYINSEKIELIENQTEVLVKEKELLFKDKGIGGVANGVSVTEIEKASQFFNKRYGQLNNEIYELKKKRNKLIQINVMLKNQINEVSTISTQSISEIQIVINSPSDKKVVVDFSFLTFNAGWAPLYDVKYNGPGQNLDFIFRANVFNASNTDWQNVNILLSTANPTEGFELPTMNTNIKTKEPVNYENENIKFRKIQSNNAITEYEIKHSYTIPSDGKPYLVEVEEVDMPSEFSYIIIPKLDNNGFLMANIPNWNKYNLISGTANIYNNGTYLGKTFLNTNTNNDTLEVFLGKDNKVEVYRKELKLDHPRNFLGNYFVDKTDVNFTIKNNYNKEIKIRMIDQVPVFNERDKIKMTISNIEKAFYNDKDGSVIWTFNLNPNEVMERNFGYTIKAPKESIKAVSSVQYRYRELSCPTF